MPRMLLVAENDDSAGRLRSWLTAGYDVAPASYAEAAQAFVARPPSVAIAVFLVPTAAATAPTDAPAVIAAVRRGAPSAPIVITGHHLRAPKWAERLAKRDRAMSLVFPMAPAALQVATRAALSRIDAERPSPQWTSYHAPRPAAAR